LNQDDMPEDELRQQGLTGLGRPDERYERNQQDTGTISAFEGLMLKLNYG